ncbi:hypothetical protein BLOT_012356 [Blomia tropicalis]|nr:hypothetical protein BLOT_012356 [Blomia tropicalis]
MHIRSYSLSFHVYPIKKFFAVIFNNKNQCIRFESHYKILDDDDDDDDDDVDNDRSVNLNALNLDI